MWNHSFNIYWVSAGEEAGEPLFRGDRIELPTGEVIHFDEATGTIDLDCLEPYVGEFFNYYVDGEFKGIHKLKEVGINKDGIKYFEVEGRL
jgi:hypothetical protein